MSARISAFLIYIAAAYSAFPSLSQTPSNRVVTAQTGSPGQNARLPYMAEYKTTQVRTLPGDSSTTQETTEVVAVDARGRRMTATTTVPSPGDQTPETRFIVFDPIAHIQISWISPGKKATVSAIPVPTTSQCSYGAMWTGIVNIRPDGGIEGPSVKTTVEILGTETIQGVEARGRRTTTTTMPVGPLGKSQPQVSTYEVWRAVDPGLRGLLAREARDDPQSGKTSKALVKFRQTEPDSSMFRLPPGYEVVNREVAMDWCPSADDVEPAGAPAR